MSIYEKKVKSTKKIINKTLFRCSRLAVYEKFLIFAVIISPQGIISFSAVVDKCLIYEYNVYYGENTCKNHRKKQKGFF